ncbi:PAS domain S-box protein [Candidatus Woesearchaeota archaeon]|nr:PAS domain S-box protein [Candidatus Woesearchaeota archaeon]
MPDKIFREILDRLPEGVSVIDRDMRIVWVNKTLREKGFDIEGCKGRRCHVVYKRNEKVCENCPAVRVFETGKQVRVLEKGADGRDYEVTAIPIKAKGAKVVKGAKGAKDGSVDRVIEIVREAETDLVSKADEIADQKCYSFIEDAEDIIFMIGADHKILSLNRRAAGMFGKKSRTAIIGRTVYDLFPKKIAESYAGEIDRVFETGESLLEESKSVFGKEQRLLRTSLNPVRDLSGKVTAVMGISRDITERSRIAKKLKQSYELLNNITDPASDAVFSKDNKRRYTFVNKAFEDMVGVKSARIIGKRPEKVFPPEIAREVRKADDDCFSGKTHDRIYKLNLNGKERYLHNVQNPIYGPEREINGVAGVVRDVTEEKRSEEVLKQSEERFRNIIEHISELYYIHDTKHRLTYVSPQSKKILGYSPEEMKIKWTELVTDNPMNRKGLKQTEKAIKTGRKQDNYTLELRRKDGRTIIVEVDESPIKDEKGKVIGITGALRDITERKKAEEALKKEKEWSERILDSAPSMMIGLGENSEILLFNKAAEMITGYKAKEVMGKSWIELFIPKKQRKEMHGVWDKVVKGKLELHHYENPVITKKGEEKLIYWSNTFLSQNSKFRMIFSIGQDVTEKRKAAEALKKNEEKFRLLFERMTQGIVYQDKDGRITSANPAAERVLGLTLSQMQGRTSVDPEWKAIHEDGSDYPGKDHPSMVALRTGRKVQDKLMGVFNPKINDHVWIKINAIPQFRKGEKKPCGVFATFEDITEQKNAEQKLRESEEKFRQLSESSPIGIYYADAKGEVLYTNPRWQKITGLTLKESLGSGWADAIHPEDRKRVKSIWRNCISNGVEGETTFRFLSSKGRTIWVNTTAVPVKDERGNIIAFVGTNQDITEQRNAEQELKESEERYRTIFNSANDVIILIDRKGFITDVNKKFFEYSGMSEKRVIGKHLKELKSLIPKRSLPVLIKNFMKRIAGADVHAYEVELYGKNRKISTFEVNAVPIRSEGKITGDLAVLRDITERKEKEEELRQAYKDLKKVDQLKSDILRDTTHELKTPISKIKMMADIAEEAIGQVKERDIKTDSLKKAKDNLKKISSNSSSFLKLISNIVNLSKVQNLENIKKEDVRLKPMVERLIKEYSSYTSEKVSLKSAVSEKCRFRANPELINLLIRNLLENAVKFTKKGRISIGCSSSKSHIVLRIKDTGPGISKKNISEIFQPFTQGDRSTQGLGIGLATCRRIAELHDGSIDVESSPGKGSEFKVRLPKR